MKDIFKFLAFAGLAITVVALAKKVSDQKKENQ
jgi:hypothetical protein